MKRFLSRLLGDRSGIAALELSLALPLLILLGVGTMEFGRLILLTQKLQNGTFILADLAARDKTLSEEHLGNIFLAINNIIQPFEFDTSGVAIVTSVLVDDDGDPKISWQRTGAGNFVSTSQVGETVGADADLPEAMTLFAGDTVIVAEIFYDYEPVFGLTSNANVLHKVAYYKRRVGTLVTLN
jgi:Flp pilus assembly protein TadG